MSRIRSPIEVEQGRKRRFGVTILGGAFFVLGTLGFFYFRATSQSVPLDDASMCATDRPPNGQIVLLIDSTDRFSAIQRAAAKKALRAIQRDVPKHARFSVFTLRASKDGELESLVSLCNPGSGKDASRFDSQPDKLKARWETGFRNPVQRLLNELLEATPAQLSPILSQLQAISISGFEDGPGERHLYILSDMLQHDSKYSHYSRSSPPSFADFQTSGMLDRFIVDLDGVSVHILYIRREGMDAVQGVNHILFWEQYFEASGAVVEEVSRLTG